MKEDELQGPKTRRQFLKTAAAVGSAVAIPSILPGTALGRDGTTAASNRITMGAIGVGGRGTGDLRAFMGERDVQFVAVCEVQKTNRE